MPHAVNSPECRARRFAAKVLVMLTSLCQPSQQSDPPFGRTTAPLRGELPICDAGTGRAQESWPSPGPQTATPPLRPRYAELAGGTARRCRPISATAPAVARVACKCGTRATRLTRLSTAWT